MRREGVLLLAYGCLGLDRIQTRQGDVGTLLERAVNGLEDSIGDLFNLPGVSQKERAEQQAQTQ